MKILKLEDAILNYDNCLIITAHADVNNPVIWSKELPSVIAWLTNQLGLGWVSVSDRLPDDTRIYLVAIAGYKHAWTASCVFGKWIGEGGKPLLGITHWRPLPTPPEGE